MSDELLTPGEQTILLNIARGTVAKAVGDSPEVHNDKRESPGGNYAAASANLQAHRGVFVTLHSYEGADRKLRGCIGRIVGDRALSDLTAEMAVSAALRDPRFPPLRANELPHVRFEISVLGPLAPITNPEEIRIGIDGLLLRTGGSSGVFLPQVPVEQDWTIPVYLEQLCKKAGVHPGAWRETRSELLRFGAQVFAEP